MRRPALAYLLAAAPLGLTPAAAEPVELFGRTLELFLPNGYCLLDAAQPNEKMLLDITTANNQASNHLVAYFVPCNDLMAYRAGAITSMTEYGILFVPLVGGSFQPAPDGRAATLRQVAASLPGIDTAMMEEIERQAQSSQGGVKIEGAQFLGLLGQDENAIYAGMLLDVSDGQQTLAAAAVIGMTVLGDVTLTANVYRPYRSNADIVALTSELAPYMAELVAANP
jgi:hypothetical protein